jgi:hypothetical protein
MILGFLLTNRYWNILEALPSRLLKCEITTCVSSLAYCSVVQDICIYYYFIRIYCARVVLFRLTTRTVPLFTIWSFGSSRRVLGLLANSLLCLVTTTQQRRGSCFYVLSGSNPLAWWATIPKHGRLHGPRIREILVVVRCSLPSYCIQRLL